MGERIARSLASYRRLFETCGITWSQSVETAHRYERVIGEHFPTLLDELHGVAQGSGVDFGSLLALNCRTEILPPDYLVQAAAEAEAAADMGNECTAFATARGGEPVLLAQNWDWVGLQRDALVLIESHPDEGPAHLTVAEAGMLAKIGLNEHGFGVTLNILRSRLDGSGVGMPIHILLRGLLDCRDLEDARGLCSALTFAGSSNVLMADAGGSIASLEASPAGARFVEADEGRLCHTNHFLNAELAEHESNLAANLSTEARLARARERIDEVRDVASAERVLSDTTNGLNSICRFPDEAVPEHLRIETVLGVVMDLGARTLHLSGAQPSESGFEAVTLQA